MQVSPALQQTVVAPSRHITLLQRWMQRCEHSACVHWARHVRTPLLLALWGLEHPGSSLHAAIAVSEVGGCILLAPFAPLAPGTSGRALTVHAVQARKSASAQATRLRALAPKMMPRSEMPTKTPNSSFSPLYPITAGGLAGTGLALAGLAGLAARGINTGLAASF